MKQEDPGRYRIEALAKGLKVLQAFTPERPELRLSELALITGLSTSSVFRILATLEEEGLVERSPSDYYRPGLGILTLGFTALRSMDLLTIARPVLARFAMTTNETVNLGKLVGSDVLYLARIRNTDLVTATVDIGTVLPGPATSMGKLQLAFLDDDARHRVITPEALSGGRGPNAIRSLDALEQALADIRERGWALQDEELEYGLRSLAVPVLSQDDTVIAAVNVAVQASRWTVTDLVRSLLPPAAAAGQEISLALGFSGDYPVDTSRAQYVDDFERS